MLGGGLLVVYNCSLGSSGTGTHVQSMSVLRKDGSRRGLLLRVGGGGGLGQQRSQGVQMFGVFLR
jgi:hypothetical protein